MTTNHKQRCGHNIVNGTGMLVFRSRAASIWISCYFLRFTHFTPYSLVNRERDQYQDRGERVTQTIRCYRLLCRFPSTLVRFKFGIGAHVFGDAAVRSVRNCGRRTQEKYANYYGGLLLLLTWSHFLLWHSHTDGSHSHGSNGRSLAFITRNTR